MKRISFIFLFILSLVTIVGCTKTKTFDFSQIEFLDQTYTYDGTEKTLTIKGEVPSGLELVYENNSRIEVGSQIAKAKFYQNTNLLKEFSATLTIIEPTIDLSGISYDDATYTYDGKEHALLLTGNIPASYEVSYENNKLTEVGATKAKATIKDYKNVIIKEFSANLTVLADAEVKDTYLSDLTATYTKVGYGNTIYLDKDSSNNPLSLKNGSSYEEFSKGIFAHAYSVLAYDELADFGYDTFSTYVGINKTGQTSNSKASVTFYVYLDYKLAYTSNLHTKDSDMEKIELDIKGVNNITLIADDMGSNGNDHAVWADAKLSYISSLKPQIIASDIELPSSYQLTNANLLSLAKAYSVAKEDISDKLTCSYQIDETNYTVTYFINYDNRITEKTVNLKINNATRWQNQLDSEEVRTPFANYVYYGYWQLRPEVRKAYMLSLSSLLKADLANFNQTKVTVNLQENDIYIYPSDATILKRYISYDEARVYFIYNWRNGDNHGVSYTTKNGFIDTISFELYNGQGGYYYNQNLDEIYSKAEAEISTWFNGLALDMTDYQAFYYIQQKLQQSLKYANVNYADGFYGAFVTKQTICSGYSKGLSYLGQRLGLRMLYDVGSAGGAHAWNRVYIDNNWYMADATWGVSLVGQKYFDDTGRYSNGTYNPMPTLNYEGYNLNLAKYPLASINNNEVTVLLDEEINLADFVTINSNVKDLITIANISCDTNFTTGNTYQRELNVTLSNGNKLTKMITFYVMTAKLKLTEDLITIPANSETKWQSGSLWDGTAEVAQEGFLMKAISNKPAYLEINVADYKAFSVNFSIDKSIRDNVAWGWQAKATVVFYADDKEVARYTNIGWKSTYQTAFINNLDAVTTLKIEVLGSSGQDRLAFGLPTLYK